MDIRVLELSPTHAEIVDANNNVLYTAIKQPHRFRSDEVTIYRGHQQSKDEDNLVAVFRGAYLWYAGRERRMASMIYAHADSPK